MPGRQGQELRMILRALRAAERDAVENPFVGEFGPDPDDDSLYWWSGARYVRVVDRDVIPDQFDAIVDGESTSNAPEVYQTLAAAVAIAEEREAIFVNDMENEPAAVTIDAASKVSRVQGKDADTTEVPVDIICLKSNMTFEQLKVTNLIQTDAITNAVTFDSLLLSGGAIALRGNFHLLKDIRSEGSRILFNTSTRIRFDVGRFSGSPLNAILMQGTAQKCSFSNLQFFAAATAYAIDTSSGAPDNSFTNLFIEDCRNGGITLSPTSLRCTLTNVRFSSSLAMLGGAAHLRIENNCLNTTVIGSRFECLNQTDLMVDDQNTGFSSTKFIGCDFIRGTLNVSQGTEFDASCTFSSQVTINWQNNADIKVFGGILNFFATEQNIPNDLVLRQVGQQNDRGPFFDVDNSVADTEPAVLVRKDTAQSIPNATVTNLTFDSQIYDNQEIASPPGMWEPTTNPDRITILRDGKYRISCRANFATDGVGIRILRCQVSSSVQIQDEDRRDANLQTFTILGVNLTLHLRLADFLTFPVFQSSGAALDILGSGSFLRSHVEVERVGSYRV